ncbi:MAG: 4-alpha-glucanotransferase [Actinomycetes bacterium]
MMLDELRRTAEGRGIATSFTDAASRHHEVSEATLRSVLEAMGPAPEPAAWPPVVVTRTGRSRSWRPPEGEPVSLVLESGEERRLPAELPGDLPPGRHRLEGRGGATTLVVAPGRCHLPPALEGGGRAWGWAAQLYAARSRSSWGIGDLGDLAELLATTAPLGARFALLNPLHAAQPAEPSPYNPSSRVFRNPLYLRVEDVPELAGLGPDDRARVEALAGAGRDLLDQDRIDRPAVYQLKDTVLRLAYGSLAGLPARQAGLAAHRGATPNLERFATFCALQHVHGPDWRDWPAPLRHPGRPEVATFGERHRDEVGYHAWLQWLLDEQLAAVPSTPEGLGVLNDLAIGFAPNGFDAWSFQDELATGISVGAPPDPLGPRGQDWGLPAFVPDRMAAGGYGPFAQTIRAGMAHAAGLRIDHVMGLFRLFWIPEGAEPAQGTYVRYPADDLLGVLALESHRAAALVVGEDLGTVEPGVRERLGAEGVLSYRLAWFEQGPDGGRRRAADYPRLALAATTTHDLPTVAGFFSGSDLAHLAEIGAVPGGDGQADQEAQRDSHCRLLEDEGMLEPGERGVEALVAALYGFLARTPAMLVAATLEDALEAHDRPNVPGTIDERPNWSLPLPVSLDDLAADPRVGRLAGILSQAVQAGPAEAERKS